ncbi:MAG: hypothetical protein COY80_03115 [Candidatus Pacebacteria bacterium CG_4_10_14_0_8_um_filter_42_14]|nr:MAG: hypothetical protein COY80_03115 [Candidatus Pacebacteria bacterium CG_4_10_14_0_8_um_filter_42_14]
MKKTDLVYVQDMIASINQIEKFLKETDFDGFVQDDRTQFAVFYALEVVGEAANKLSKEFRAENSQVPVREAVEMRNILIHGYDEIKLEIVWKTIYDHVFPLRKQLEEIAANIPLDQR